MIRTAIVLLAAAGTLAAAAAFQDAPAGTPAVNEQPTVNQTIIEKNSAFPVVGPVVFTQCMTDDCSDVAESPNG